MTTDKPWRQIKGWDRGVREELREHVASLAPDTKESVEVPFFNILLAGRIGDGRSSFFNSINSLFRNQITVRAEAGASACCLTKKFSIYEVRTSAGADPLPWRIWDTMGVDAGTGEVDVRNILNAVDGHVPDQHRFTPGEDFYYGCPGYVANPTLADQAHCVAIVVNARRMDQTSQEILAKLRSLKQGLSTRGIPACIILTHIDEACQQIKQNVQYVHRSVIIRDIVSRVSKQLMGLPENQIFPVKNYTYEVDLEDDVDILILYALRQMLYSAQDYIENK